MKGSGRVVVHKREHRETRRKCGSGELLLVLDHPGDGYLAILNPRPLSKVFAIRTGVFMTISQRNPLRFNDAMDAAHYVRVVYPLIDKQVVVDLLQRLMISTSGL